MNTDKWTAFPVGTRVRCANPDDFYADTARKLRNRVGEIVKHQMFSGNPIVEFPAVGRRKPYTWVPSNPDWVAIEKEEPTP
jgi:hypothetical protein